MLQGIGEKSKQENETTAGAVQEYIARLQIYRLVFIILELQVTAIAISAGGHGKNTASTAADIVL